LPPVEIVGANVAALEVATTTELLFVKVHAYAQPFCDPDDVTANEQGEPALSHPLLVIVGSGALRGSVSEADTA
jgi:hypothetical protein